MQAVALLVLLLAAVMGNLSNATDGGSLSLHCDRTMYTCEVEEEGDKSVCAYLGVSNTCRDLDLCPA